VAQEADYTELVLVEVQAVADLIIQVTAEAVLLVVKVTLVDIQIKFLAAEAVAQEQLEQPQHQLELMERLVMVEMV
jgi:hypothetical protein